MQYRNGMTFTWSNGRKLASATQNGATTTFTYDGEGIRIRKVSGNTTVDYIVIGGTICGEIRTENGTTTKMHYLFDENGTRIGFVVDGEDSYYYRFNLQGDVTGIFNESGTLVAEYTYDAWGNLIDSDNTAIGLLNPIRYRGYYYDSETGLYYLQTRYYDPVTCRFINADGLLSTGQGILATICMRIVLTIRSMVLILAVLVFIIGVSGLRVISVRRKIVMKNFLSRN